MSDIDRPRLLASYSEHAYTDDPMKALRDEPEAIPPDERERQTAAARRRELERRNAEWALAKQTLRVGVEQAQQALGRGFSSDVRVIERVVRRIDHRVGGQ